MAEKTILGHIDCPACGTAGGMRITHDKNGEPFGFCEAKCNAQFRIGGSRERVALFVGRFPWAAKPGEVKAKQPLPEQKPAPRRSGFDMGL